MKGYIILARNNVVTDYVRLAYALALSIKITQSTVNSVAIMTNDIVPDKYKSVFDHIIPIPDYVESSEKWNISDKWKYIHASPFDETVVLDADMIMTSDISYWWDIMGEHEFYIAQQPITFRGDPITSHACRKIFVANNLPHAYTAFMYFKKTESTYRLFKVVETLFKNPKDTLSMLTGANRLSGDLVFGMAMKICNLGIDNIKTYPTFVHMRGILQNIGALHDIWSHILPTYLSENCTLYIGNFLQYVPFHYHEKEWMTDLQIEKLRGAYVRTI